MCNHFDDLAARFSALCLVAVNYGLDTQVRGSDGGANCSVS